MLVGVHVIIHAAPPCCECLYLVVGSKGGAAALIIELGSSSCIRQGSCIAKSGPACPHQCLLSGIPSSWRPCSLGQKWGLQQHVDHQLQLPALKQAFEPRAVPPISWAGLPELMFVMVKAEVRSVDGGVCLQTSTLTCTWSE